MTFLQDKCNLKRVKTSIYAEHLSHIERMYVSQRCLDRIYSFILLAIVLLSWGYVIYGTRIAAQWELEKRTNMQT